MEYEVYYTGGGIWIAEARMANGQYYSVDSFMDGLNLFNPPPSGNADDMYMPEDMVWSKGVSDLTINQMKLYFLLCHMIEFESHDTSI